MAMTLEDLLCGWTGPSSATEQDKQDRTERMIKDAVQAHEALGDCSLTVFAKGSYPNNTNVRVDSDVDIAVQCHNALYWGEATKGANSPGEPYGGPWTPQKLREEVLAALRVKFGSQVDDSGSSAIRIHSSSARVDADVTCCFDYRYYLDSGEYRDGTKAFRNGGGKYVNYPAQNLEHGRLKNTRTNQNFKKCVRILKRVENAMVEKGLHREVQSFFVECLVYNCPDSTFTESTWVDRIRGVLAYVRDGLQGEESSDSSDRWLEVSRCKYLFTPVQKWTRADGRDFAQAAWEHLGLKG